MFLSLADKGSIFSILKNWPERRVKAICLTDGSRIGPFGDLGVQAIGVPISRLSLYTACGGIIPSACLPVTIDAGGLGEVAAGGDESTMCRCGAGNLEGDGHDWLMHTGHDSSYFCRNRQ